MTVRAANRDPFEPNASLAAGTLRPQIASKRYTLLESP
jgi:hypothetical protein